MKTVNVIQGTPEWHAHRANHFNASDAPAMMGCSPHETRNELLQRIKMGRVADVDAATQRRFDDGHKFEALARPLAEAISSAGGVVLNELDKGLMLRKLPGVFCAGEMLDWEAPTGGYLLTAVMASGYVAGHGIVKYLR